MSQQIELSEIVGKTFSNIINSQDEITFECTDGTSYRMNHHQDCCESVSIESMDGDLNDLLNSPILEFEERVNPDGVTFLEKGDDEYGTWTWTFYVIRNVKASVTIRWYGTSNGYYSEDVIVEKIN